MKNLDEMNEERRLSKPRNTTFLYILEIRRRRLLCKGSVVLNRASLKGRHDEIQGISISARFQLPPVSPLYLSCASSLETEVKGSFQGHGSNWDHLLACISLFLFFFFWKEKQYALEKVEGKLEEEETELCIFVVRQIEPWLHPRVFDISFWNSSFLSFLAFCFWYVEGVVEGWIDFSNRVLIFFLIINPFLFFNCFKYWEVFFHVSGK